MRMRLLAGIFGLAGCVQSHDIQSDVESGDAGRVARGSEDSSAETADASTLEPAALEGVSAEVRAFAPPSQTCLDEMLPLEMSTFVPQSLGCTGLYKDLKSKTLADDVHEYTPAVVLWSDGSEKHRFVHIPKGKKIDASDMNQWIYPVGTKLFKEFRDEDGKRVETRLFAKVSSASIGGWKFGTYRWNDDETEAVYDAGGEVEGRELAGFPYAIPTRSQCRKCHDGNPENVLGFEPASLGLPGAKGMTLRKLADLDLLDPVPDRVELEMGDDGTGLALPAMGWLHANCGVSCHNERSTADGQSSRLYMRLRYDQLDGSPSDDFDARQLTIGVLAKTVRWAGSRPRIVPGKPDESLLMELIETRDGSNDQMPPIASQVVDDDHAEIIREWIAAMEEGVDALGEPLDEDLGSSAPTGPASAAPE